MKYSLDTVCRKLSARGWLKSYDVRAQIKFADGNDCTLSQKEWIEQGAPEFYSISLCRDGQFRTWYYWEIFITYTKLKYECHTYPIYKYKTCSIHFARILTEAITEAAYIQDNDTIGLACSGSSGLYLATMMQAMHENFEVLYVRKDGEKSHGTSSVEGLDEERYDLIVVVDDFMSSGRTVNWIVKRLEENNYIRYDELWLACSRCTKQFETLGKFSHLFF